MVYPATCTVAHTAFPILEKYFVPTVKRIGRDLIESAVSKIGIVFSGKSSFKKAIRKSASTALRKQLGGGKRQRKTLLNSRIKPKGSLKPKEEPLKTVTQTFQSL